MNDVQAIVQTILDKRPQISAHKSMLVAVSGIDGSGKGYITARIVAGLQQQRVNATAINIDGWLNLPSKRFNQERPAEHFYHHAIRFDEMFAQLVLPLKQNRSVWIEADFAEETASTYRKQIYDFQNVDVIVLEGIYLLKRAFHHYYDWTVWVDCTFETALERALQRGQEGLPPDETIRAYQTIYFPAQQLHFQLDQPRTGAEALLINDPRLVPEKL